MTYVLLSISEHELLISQIVKSTLLVITSVAILINIYSLIRIRKNRHFLIRIAIICLLVLLLIPILKWLRIDGALLRSPKFSYATTNGMCELWARGKGISFEYKIGEKIYKSCSTYHPVKLEDIVVNDGKYPIRYTLKYPEHARIDFSKQYDEINK